MVNLFTYLKNNPKYKDKFKHKLYEAKKSLLDGEIEITKVLKEKLDCLYKYSWEQAHLSYGLPIGKSPFYPICPNAKSEIRKMPLPNILPAEQYSPPILNYIKRIMAVFEHLLSIKPNTDEVVLCAHRDNILKDYLDLIKDDLDSLPKSLERDYPITSYNCKGFIQNLSLQAEIYEADHYPCRVYELPDPSKQYDYSTLLNWQNQPGRGRYALHYPAAAIAVMAEFRTELNSLVKTFTRKEKTEPQRKDGQGKEQQPQEISRLVKEITDEATNWLKKPEGIYPFNDRRIMTGSFIVYGTHTDPQLGTEAISRIDRIKEILFAEGKDGLARHIEQKVDSVKKEQLGVDRLVQSGRKRERCLTSLKQAVRELIGTLNHVVTIMAVPQEKTGQVKMNPQQKSKIKEHAEKLLSLCVEEPFQPHKTSGNGHWESRERDAYKAGEMQDKCRRAYRKKILDILGDDANDWIFITRTFEDLKPKWFSRLDSMRQEILLHTHPDNRQVNWLEPQGCKLGPNKSLRSLIEQLANELHQVERDINEENGETESHENGGKGEKPKSKKKRRKAPTGLLKEARERQAVKELVKNPNITCRELGKILGCHETTVIRLKAWKERGVLSYEGQEGLTTRQEDDSYNVDGVVRNKREE
jgi:hypothetical protein